jgi:hypothetical protein
MAQFQANNAVHRHTKIDWTVKHLLALHHFIASSKTTVEIASEFGPTVQKIARGYRKLEK